MLPQFLKSDFDPAMRAMRRQLSLMDCVPKRPGETGHGAHDVCLVDIWGHTASKTSPKAEGWVSSQLRATVGIALHW